MDKTAENGLVDRIKVYSSGVYAGLIAFPINYLVRVGLRLCLPSWYGHESLSETWRKTFLVSLFVAVGMGLYVGFCRKRELRKSQTA